MGEGARATDDAPGPGRSENDLKRQDGDHEGGDLPKRSETRSERSAQENETRRSERCSGTLGTQNYMESR